MRSKCGMQRMEFTIGNYFCFILKRKGRRKSSRDEMAQIQGRNCQVIITIDRINDNSLMTEQTHHKNVY